MVEYLHPKLKKLFIDVAANPFVFYLNGKKTFKTENLQALLHCNRYHCCRISK